MEKALPVMDYVAFDSSVEDTGDISNMTAEQYLSWVRYQANELPDVFTANVDSTIYAGRQTKYMPEIEEVCTCPEHLLPSAEWERDVISAFSDLRALLARLSLSEGSRERKLVVPQLKDEQAWLKFCLDSEYQHEASEILPVKSSSSMHGGMDVDENSYDFEQRKLELSKILETSFGNGDIVVSAPEDQEDHNDSDAEGSADGSNGAATKHSVQTNYAVWGGAVDSLPTTTLLLQFDQVMTQRILGYQVSWLEGRESVSSARGQWLYGLLARLEKPLDRTMASLLRELYRRCSQLRASADEDDCDFDVQIASLNVLIVITGSYFEQGEEYSTLCRGYDEIEEDEEEDFDEDDDHDDGDYYFEDEMEDNAEGTLPGGFKIGDDIWSDRPGTTDRSDDVTSSEKNICVESSYLRKRTAEGSAEEGEAEEGEEEEEGEVVQDE